MDTTFKIKKTDKKTDLIGFILNELESVAHIDKNVMIVGDTSIYVTFGKTYIRIQDAKDNPTKITQLFYDVPLNINKYVIKLREVIESSVAKTVAEKDMITIKEKYISLLEKFIVSNKYTYEPYSIDKFYVNDEFFIIASDNNFELKMFLSDEKLMFRPKIDKKIIDDLSPTAVSDVANYVNIIDIAIKKIDRLKKVISLAINDINNAIIVNIKGS